MSAEPLLVVEDLVKHYHSGRGLRRRAAPVRALDGVSFSLEAGETLGVVGESGCGKSTLARLLTVLERPTSGGIRFGGVELSDVAGRELRRLRRDVQLILQDPYTALDPRMTVAEIVAEPLYIHRDVIERRRRPQRARELLDMVGLGPEHLERYPHQLSGGQRQRVGIARALALSPKLLICDEPVSALDVSVQAQVINLLSDLQRDLRLAYVFIAHDLSIVRHVSDRIAVMYLGCIVEIGDQRDVCEEPEHPYTHALLSAVPEVDPSCTPAPIVLPGDPPDPADPPSGCRFRTRCWRATERCATSPPELVAQGPGNRLAACHHPGSDAPLSRQPAVGPLA